MHLRQIEVTNLFGSINLSLPLNTEAPVTIVHAPNGYGKTTLLKLVNALMNKRFPYLFETPFETLRITYSCGDLLCVTKRQTDRSVGELERRRGRRFGRRLFPPSFRDWRLIFDLKRANGEKKVQPLTIDEIEDVLIDLDHPAPNELLGSERLRMRLLSRHRHNYLRHLAEESDITELIPHQVLDPWLVGILKNVPTCLIEANRLESTPQPDLGEQEEGVLPRLTVLRDSQELAETIQQTYESFSNTSQTLDRELPRRLLSGENESPNKETSKEEIEAKYKRIIGAGLLQEGHATHFPDIPEHLQNDATMRRVLNLYYANQALKLSEFDHLLERIEPLIALINEHFYEKTLRLDPSVGFRVESKSGDSIPLHGLSSGEQHQLVLFYRLLFKVEPDAFVMIDEPEISLHAAWQQVFLKDLLRVAANKRAQFLVATHSPLIVDDQWEFTVALAQK